MPSINIRTTSKISPQIYAYTIPQVPDHRGWTKIGFTERNVNKRIDEQLHTAGIKPKIEWNILAAYMTEPFGTFTDKDFHAYLQKLGIERDKGTEWFKIDPQAAKNDLINFTQNHGIITKEDSNLVIPYKLRDEQEQAVKQTLEYFKNHKNGEFLWNAKPRFGKTLSTYDLCKKLGAKNILIVTNRPAIANSWYSDYEKFFGVQSGYYFVSNVDGIKDKKYVMSRDEYVNLKNM